MSLIVSSLDFISGSSGETSASIFSIGYSYNMGDDGLYLQPSIAFGSATVTSNLGTVAANGTMPVIITDGTFYKGDEISSEATGSATKFGLELGYKIANRVLTYLSFDFWSTSLDEPKTTINDIEITDMLGGSYGVHYINSYIKEYHAKKMSKTYEYNFKN